MPKFIGVLAAPVQAYSTIEIEAADSMEADRKLEELVAKLNAGEWPAEIEPFNPDYSTIDEFRVAVEAYSEEEEVT